MKNYILIILIFAITGFGFSQNQASDFTGRKSDQRRDPRADLMNFVPNEVIVKFKDEVPMQTGARMKAAGVNSVDKVLQTYGVTSLEKLFPSEQKPLRARMMKSPQGKEMKIPALDKIYKISVPLTSTNNGAPTNILQLIEELKAQPEVEYAEPNYIYSIDDMQPVGPILTAEDVQKLQSNNPNKSKVSFNPNDPLYGQQWYIQAVKADSVWQQTTGDSTQVIAILDTGVDWNHPDLKNKIWKNPNPNATPDANGVVNDIRGWDYINNDNNPSDDNSHGTHVAGIAAAETNNGIGIAGVCPKAKIMPVKVFQSSGRGDAATITKGIIYASTHGATVINMSFGSYANSMAMEDALANAYATCVLVAAAGNDEKDIELECLGQPFFPAALSYVLGVQAPEASFSNTDCTGPTFSKSSALYNYEMKAPGTNIISTIPNGNYRIYQGTSMATPIVSGAAALYNSVRSKNESDVLMWVKLIQSTSMYLDINTAINLIPKSEVRLISQTMVDSIPGDDNDGRVDAGENIQFWFTARNTGGQSDSTWFKLRLHEFEDATTVKIIKPISFIGSMSPYAIRTSQLDPMKIQISPNVMNDRDIVFDLLMWHKDSPDTTIQQVVLNVENGEQLVGVLDTTLTLTHDKLWLIKSSFRVGSAGILIINPGARVENVSGIVNKGQIISIGKADSLIVIDGPGGFSGPGSFIFRFTNFQKMVSNFGNSVGLGTSGSYSFDNCQFLDINTGWNYLFGCHQLNLKESLIKNCICGYGLFPQNYFGMNNISVERNNIINSLITYATWADGLVYLDKMDLFKYNNVVKLNTSLNGQYPSSFLSVSGDINFQQEYNNFIGFSSNNNWAITAKISNVNMLPDVIQLPKQYWGTIDLLKISRNNIFDFWDEADLPQVNFSKFLVQPSELAHGIVWKVLVNGKDPQDETVESVGVGKQRFDVYFNQPMDKKVTPQLSFGVRLPYSQQSVNEEGSWSEDGHIYTAYKTIKLTTGDGINRIRISEAKDLEGWEIPIEDMRFEFLISAASSSSLEFMATPGLGKVNLEWNNNKLADGLGYNLYRMEQINDSTLSSPIMINSSLITDTLYSDFSVTPQKKYFYFYKILRTNFAETDSSKVVSATPFTASKGDANGDLSVNVLDITSIVAYLLNNNPQPFIFEAADVNSDKNINVLDIVGVVSLVLNGPQKVKATLMDQQASLYMENDTLFADVNVPVGGIQFDISGISSIEDIQVLKVLDGFESGYSMKNDTLRLLYYSMSGKSIPAGNHIPLVVMKKGSKIANAVFGGTNGSPILVNFILTNIGNISKNMNQSIAELGQNYPNPLTGQTTIPIHIYEPVDEAIVRIVNMMGQEVEIIRMSNPYIGEHLLSWDSGQNKGLFVYMLEIMNNKQKQICPIKKMIVQ